MVNVQVPGGKGGNAAPQGNGGKILSDFYSKHYEEQKEIDMQFEALRNEAIRTGLISG